MAHDASSSAKSLRERPQLLRDQVQLVKRKDSDGYEIVPVANPLSFEKGFFIVIRACQLLAQSNDGLILVGVAGQSGDRKTLFTEKALNFMPSIAVITMDNYRDSSHIIDGNFDDLRLTDYDTLLENIHDLKAGKPVQVPVYDFRSSSRTGYRTVEVPRSRIVIIEGIYALSEKLRALLDLRVSVIGGVHLELVHRVLQSENTQQSGQEPEEIFRQIAETVYPMHKVFIEPDLQTEHIKIINKFDPFSGLQNPTYILKSARAVTVDQIKAVISREHIETVGESYDIYLLPPGEDPNACQSYMRLRNKDGKFNLMFEEWRTDSPFIISPRITFEVSVHVLEALIALGYTFTTSFKRSSHVFSDDKVCVKIDWLEQLKRQYVQVQGRDHRYVNSVAEGLGLEGSYAPRTYIEQIQLEKLVNDVMALPDDLKKKLRIGDDLVLSPKVALSRASADRRMNYLNGILHPYRNQQGKMQQLARPLISNRSFNRSAPESPSPRSLNRSFNPGVVTQLSEQISALNERMDEFADHFKEMNSKFSARPHSSSSSQLLPLQNSDEHSINIGDTEDIGREGGSSRKVKTGYHVWILPIANFLLELVSVAFDQFSSVHKPEYALAAMLMAFVGLLGCAMELAFKGGKERAMWRWDREIPWFYCSTTTSTSYRRFGSYAEIFGLACAMLQSISATVAYVSYSHRADNPIKVSFLPLVFAIGLLCSQFLKGRSGKVTEPVHRD